MHDTFIYETGICVHFCFGTGAEAGILSTVDHHL